MDGTSREKRFCLFIFIENNLVAIGWNKVGALKSYYDREVIKQQLKSTYPEFSSRQVGNAAGQIFRFFKEFKIGDYVVSYNSNNRTYAIAKIVSNYKYNSEYPLNHFIPVKWLYEGINRDWLSDEAKKTLNPLLSVFKIKFSTLEELKLLGRH